MRWTKCRVIAQWICKVSSPHGPADGDGACRRAVTWAHRYRAFAQLRTGNAARNGKIQITGVIKPKGRDGRSVWHAWETGDVHTGFWLGNLKVKASWKT